MGIDILNHREETSVFLKELATGDTFSRGAHVCIVTDQIDPDGDIQVVDLATGELHRYPPDNKVTAVLCKIEVF